MLDSFALRDALVALGFKPITDPARTKAHGFTRNDLAHPIYLKIRGAKGELRPATERPLVLHASDADRLRRVPSLPRGFELQTTPYKSAGLLEFRSSGSTATPFGFDATVRDSATLAQVIDLLRGPAEREVAPLKAAALINADESPSIDPLVWAAATADIDAGLQGRVVTATTRTALIEARIGQGRYREDLLKIWQRRCAVTGCGIEKALIASHVVPWRENKNPETCLDPYNGLLLTASIDRLFDQGLISFDDTGRLLRCDALRGTDLLTLGIAADAKLRALSPKHLPYLAAHRAAHRIKG